MSLDEKISILRGACLKMDPQSLTTDQWAQVGFSLKMLWLALACSLIAGPSLLFAHAIIPSAVDTNTIPKSWTKIRPLLYAVGLLAVVGILIFFYLFINHLDFLKASYPRWWQ